MVQNLCLNNKIVALRNEKGSYNINNEIDSISRIVALRNEKGSYNPFACIPSRWRNCSTAK